MSIKALLGIALRVLLSAVGGFITLYTLNLLLPEGPYRVWFFAAYGIFYGGGLVWSGKHYYGAEVDRFQRIDRGLKWLTEEPRYSLRFAFFGRGIFGTLVFFLWVLSKLVGGLKGKPKHPDYL